MNSITSNNVQKLLHIGFDDTDSRQGMCTTYIGFKVVRELLSNPYFSQNVDLQDFPLLIRLNPNVPHRTRGNGAVALRLLCTEESLERVIELVTSYVTKFSELNVSSTCPGVAYIVGEVPEIIKIFAKRALYDVISKEEALNVSKESGATIREWNCGRGIIGALAALGTTLTEDDYTFEFITYRVNTKSKERRFNPLSVWRGDAASPLSFSNVDPTSREVKVAPKGPDPVYMGIRGETPESTIEVWKHIEVQEELEGGIIFRSNQGTGTHFNRITKIDDLKPWQSVILEGTITDSPSTIQGGHLLFRLQDETGKDARADKKTVSRAGRRLQGISTDLNTRKVKT